MLSIIHSSVLIDKSDAFSSYRMESYEKIHCVVIVEIDAVLNIAYHKPGENITATAALKLPKYADSVRGQCFRKPFDKMEDVANLELRFDGIILKMHFINTTKYWRFDSIDLEYSTHIPLFENFDIPEEQVSTIGLLIESIISRLFEVHFFKVD